MEIAQSEQQNEKLKNENRLRNLFDRLKHTNICIKTEKGVKNVSNEIMAENITNLKKETDIQEQEAQRVPKKIIPTGPSPRCIIIKMQNLKTKREF